MSEKLDVKSAKNKRNNNKATITSLVITVQIMLNMIVYALAIFAIIQLSKSAFDFSYQIYGDVRAEEEPGQKISFEIEEGASSYNIATQLEKNSVIVNKYAFLVKLKLAQKDVYPSTYMLTTSMTYDEIIDTICSGNKNIK